MTCCTWTHLLRPGEEARPVAAEQVVYPSFAGLDQVIEQIYTHLTASDPNFGKFVPLSAFAYYCAVLSYGRIIKINKLNGRRTTHDEDQLVATCYSDDFKPPAMLAQYLSGFGNVDVDKVHLACRFRQRAYQEAGNMIGWFGQFDLDTFNLYLNYPCISVYASAMIQDVARTDDNDLPAIWDFPQDIMPVVEDDDPQLHPTMNILGYRPAVIMNHYRRGFMADCDITVDGFDSQNDSMPISIALMTAIQTKIDSSRDAKQVPMPYIILQSIEAK